MLLLVAGISSLPQGAWGSILGVLFILAAVAWKIGGMVIMSKRRQQAEEMTSSNTPAQD